MRNGLLLFVPFIVLLAQGGDPWRDLRGQYPETAVQIRLVDPRVYRQGELIRAQVIRTLPPEAGVWRPAGLLLDPPAECGTVAKPCIARQFGPLNADFVTLNAFLPQGLTGHYRVAFLSSQSNSVAYAVSNTVEIDFATASPEWIRDTIAKIRTTLSEPQRNDPMAQVAREDAAQQLAALNGLDAWNAALDFVSQDENTLLSGVAAGTPAKDVCDLMSARVSSPTQSVSDTYLWRMADVCARANLPPAPAPPAATRPQLVIRAQISVAPLPAATPVVQPPPEVRDWSGKYNSYTREVRDSAAANLAASLQQKQPAARSAAVSTLIQYIRHARPDRSGIPDPSWLPLLSAEFAHEFQAAEYAEKVQLLLLYSSVIDSPDEIPMADSLLEAWRPGDSYEGPHTALRVLQSIAPEQAQKRILAELTKPNSWLDPSVLDFLPPNAVPPMDDMLINAWMRELQPGGSPSGVIAAAIAKYATPQALPRIKGIFESNVGRCQPESMAYFVRVDPAYAARVFHSHAWDMQAHPPACTLQYFMRTSQLAMGPPLEEYLSAYLMHSDAHVKTVAAQSLARYGSPVVLPKLWDTFRYFHEYWKGKETELNTNGQGVALEVELRNAIARGRQWLATDADFREIDSLCSSRQCKDDTRMDLARWTDPFPVEITDQPIGVRMRIAQYELDSVDFLKNKLQQFPKESRFTVTASGVHAARIAAEFRQFAAEKGFRIAP